MDKNKTIPEFLLFGGPLHRLGSCLGLVRGKTNTIRLGLALGFLAWVVLMLLAFLQGSVLKMFSLSVINVHVRLLVAIPLFFFCETLVAPRMQDFISNIVRSDLVAESELPKLASDIRWINRIKDSWLMEVIFLLVVFALPLLEMVFHLPGKTASWMWIIDKAGGRLTWLNGWYLMWCLPLFRFLMLRWLWYLGLWWYFLRRLAKLKLQLIPTHSDGSAGLGYLEVVHEHFMPLVVAISAVFSAQFAEDIFSGTMAFEALYRLIPVIFFLCAVLFIGPLFIFFRKLWIARVNGLNRYMILASDYVQTFHHKWTSEIDVFTETHLGTPDIQSLADLTNSVSVIREMRCVPFTRRLTMELAVCVVLPMVPLLIMKFRFDQLIAGLFKVFTGQ